MRSKNGEKQRTFIEEARRAQIIQAAIETIAEHGYPNASLARIAKHAGISKGVISYHFAGKDELIDEVVKVIYTAIIEHVVPEIEAAPDPRAALRAQILTVGEYVRGHVLEMNALNEIFSSARDAEGKPRYGFAGTVELYKGNEILFQKGQEEGAFRDFDRRVMAITMQAAIDAAFGYWAVFPEHDIAGHMIELAELLDRAMRAD